MTVQELIEELGEIQNKEVPVFIRTEEEPFERHNISTVLDASYDYYNPYAVIIY